MSINQWNEFRKPTWEEDISLNHDTTDVFENDLPPCEIPLEQFIEPLVFQDSLLECGDELSDFVARDSIPLPGWADREFYNRDRPANFFLFGLADYLKIYRAVKKYDVEVSSYFDFGCASGRVLRHFVCHSDVQNLWGSDINGRHIRWINDHFPPRVRAIHNNCLPQISIADQSMDLISAFSVFTHIDTFETTWLAELYRILKPGGLCYLTVNNDATWQALREADDKVFMRKRIKEIAHNGEELLSQPIPPGRTCLRYTDVGPYRALVFHSDDYLKRTWGRYFETLEIVPQHHGRFQSVLIGRKRT